MNTWTKAKLHFRRSALLLGLALGVGVSLGAADLFLTPRILANQAAETTRRIPELVPGATHSREVTHGSERFHAALNENGETVGWVFPAQGRGFAGPIELLVGMDPTLRTVTGLHVLAQSETPGLGNRITQPAWLTRLTGTPPGDGYKLGRDLDGLSGATVSSTAVVDAINLRLTTLPDPGEFQ